MPGLAPLETSMPASPPRHAHPHQGATASRDPAACEPQPIQPLAGSARPHRPSCHNIRDARATDLGNTARLHVGELPVGLFPRLGVRFVSRWHRAFVDSPHAVALVAVDPDAEGGEHIGGFLIGATDGQAFLHELLTRHRTALLRHGIIALAVRPRTLAKFLRTRLRPYLRRLWHSDSPARHIGGAGPATTSRPVADLTAIAVVPSLRRTGAGRALVDEFLGRCSRAGTTTVELVTATTSEEAVAFYSATGWTALELHVTKDGVPVQRFRRRPGRRDAG